MKKIKFILPILFLLFANCSDEDDKVTLLNQLEINNSNISGKWYIKGGTTNGGAFENYVHDCSTNKDYQDFKTNGELDFVGYNSSCATTEVETSLWSLSNGNTLHVNSLPNEPIPHTYVYEILSLTSEELILEQTYNDPSGQIVEVSHYTRN